MILSSLVGRVGALALPLLHRLDAETAHGMTIAALRALPPTPAPASDPALAVEAFGLSFPNPVGIAAGFDKNAEVPDALLGLGLGFAEVGTVTPLPQAGNPRPRMFRLPADMAVINRLGFNNEGHAAALARLELRGTRPGIVGVNIGANKDSTDRIADYVKGIELFGPVAAYFTVNVSSPNTPGLRDLQHEAALDELLARVMDARARATNGRPVLVKIAPDLLPADLDTIVAVMRRRQVDGMIVSNTTVSRPNGLRETATAREQGGLSGRPLLPLANRTLAEVFVRAEGQFPLIGVGGIHSAASALQKIEAGATLIQLYSALVYRGMPLVDEIKSELARAAKATGPGGLARLVGRSAADLSAQPYPG